jgi:hypothetical protein
MNKPAFSFSRLAKEISDGFATFSIMPPPRELPRSDFASQAESIGEIWRQTGDYLRAAMQQEAARVGAPPPSSAPAPEQTETRP